MTNAAVRDIAEIRESRFPVYAPGTSVRGTSKAHAGWMNQTIAIGDAVVRPGDFLFGDDDGLIVVPAERMIEVAIAAIEQRSTELSKEARLRAGESIREVMGFK